MGEKRNVAITLLLFLFGASVLIAVCFRLGIAPYISIGNATVFQATKDVNDTVFNLRGSFDKMYENSVKRSKDYPTVKWAVILINFGTYITFGLMIISSSLLCCVGYVKKRAKSAGGCWSIVHWAILFMLFFPVLLLVVSIIIKPSSHIIFVEVIGSDVGFTWSDLQPMARVVFACDIITSFTLIVCAIVTCIAFVTDRPETRRKKKCKAFVTDRPETRRKKKCKVCKMTKPQSTNDSFLSVHYKIPTKKEVNEADIDLYAVHIHVDETAIEPVRTLVQQLWDQSLVGVGRDARNIAHRGIKITNIQRLQNDKQMKLYNRRKKHIVDFARSVCGKLKSPEDYKEGIKPVATKALVHVLGLNVDCEINEVYLFHGTQYANVKSIEQNGFRRGKGGMLGCGIYFTDHPVKADQYAKGDGNEKFCMILSRVLLGDTVIQTKPISDQGRTVGRPPCKTCCNVDTGKCRPFDSLLYDGGLFREYVVYESCLAYPEYAIEYIRQNIR